MLASVALFGTSELAVDRHQRRIAGTSPPMDLLVSDGPATSAAALFQCGSGLPPLAIGALTIAWRCRDPEAYPIGLLIAARISISFLLRFGGN